MGFAEDVSNLNIPIDKNGNPVALLTTVDVGTGEFAPVASTQLADGSYAVKIVSAGAASVPDADAITPIAVTDAATVLLAASPLRKGHVLFNAGSNTVYVGVSNALTTATAIPIAPGASFSLDIPGTIYTGDIYGICATGLSSEIRGISYHE